MSMNRHQRNRHRDELAELVDCAVKDAIRMQVSEAAALESVRVTLEALRADAPRWMRAELLARARGAMQVVHNHMTVSGWKLSTPYRGVSFIRIWTPESSIGSCEPRPEPPSLTIPDLQADGVALTPFERQFVVERGQYWPNLKPFSVSPGLAALAPLPFTA